MQKQIQAASKYCFQSVLYIKSEEDLEVAYLIENKKVNEVVEIHISYRKSSSRAQQFILLNKMYELGLKEVEKLNGIPDILHVHNLITPAIWANKYAKRMDVPWVLSEHWSGFTSVSGLFEAKMKWERKLWQWYSEKAVYCISVSEFLNKSLISCKIGRNHKVIANVVEGSLATNKREDNETRILVVGDMVDRIKNISGAMRAFSKVSTKDDALRLWIVGGGEDYDSMIELSKELGIDKKVKFFGRLANDEVLPIYHDIDFTLINSRIETFSVVAAESLLAGKPVISTCCGGVEEFMDEDKGYLVAIDDENELIQAMNKMLQTFNDFDPITLSSFAKSKFSSEAVGKDLFEVYESIAK